MYIQYLNGVPLCDGLFLVRLLVLLFASVTPSALSSIQARSAHASDSCMPCAEIQARCGWVRGDGWLGLLRDGGVMYSTDL